jgi:hypothetical protein
VRVGSARTPKAALWTTSPSIRLRLPVAQPICNRRASSSASRSQHSRGSRAIAEPRARSNDATRTRCYSSRRSSATFGRSASRWASPRPFPSLDARRRPRYLRTVSQAPYGVIWRALSKGLAVPFLGAGASLLSRGASDRFNESAPTCLPTTSELTQVLAEEASFPRSTSGESADLAKVSSYYADIAGRVRLRERLRELVGNANAVSSLHTLLASVAAPLLIISTNYDDQIERAFRAANRPYDLVIYPADRLDLCGGLLWWRYGAASPEEVSPNRLAIDLNKTTVIFKMHGSLAPDASGDNFVITEEDYVEFLSRMTDNSAFPPIFFEHFRRRSFLFLGYSLRDWNFRVVLRNLSRHLSAAKKPEDLPPSWAIQLEPSEFERQLWARRGVSIFDADLAHFVGHLEGRRDGTAGSIAPAV